MDGRYLESNLWLRDDFSRLHELLRNAYGSATASNATSGLCGYYSKERRTSCMDGKNSLDRKSVGDSHVVEKAAKNICKFDVGPFSGRRAIAIH